jgi:hypothetical protein
MTREIALELGAAAAVVALVIGVAAFVATTPAADLAPEGAGPVLLEALEAGWRPAPPAVHRCASCVNCCERCNVKDQCCCWHADKCSCVKDPTHGWDGPVEATR